MAYADNFIPEVWSKKLMSLSDKIMVMAGLVNRDYEGEIKEAGDTVHVRSFGDITVRNYTRAQTLTDDTLVDPMSDLVIDQLKYTSFVVDDVDKAQADINIMEGYLKRAAYAIKLVVDQFLHAQYANVNAANVIGSSSLPVTLTKDNIYFYMTELRKTLKNANVTGDINVVVDPTREALFLNSPEFIRSTGMGDKTVGEGNIGKIAGMNIHVSTNLNSSSGNRPILAFTKDFISFARQLTKIETERVPGTFLTRCKALYVYGAKVFTNSNTTASTAPDKQGASLWAAGT